MEALLFLATLFCFASCDRSPTISFISKEMVANIGDTVDLDCSVQYLGSYPLLWVKIQSNNNTLFLSQGSGAIVPDQRFSVRHDESSSTYTLQIAKLQETDSGLYMCRIVLSPTSQVSAEVWVHVRVPPIISDNSTRSVITSTGSNVTLECYAGGYPKPTISWRRENNDLLPTGGSMYRGNVLNIFNVSKDDRGTYYCIADNRVDSGARRNIGVEVEFAPVVTVNRPRYGQALQNPMDLECHVEAFPSPSVIWLKDGYHLNDNQFYRISIFSTADELTDTTLRIIAIEKKQYGNYTCKAINKLGSAEAIVELYETVNVICPPSCDKTYSSDATSLRIGAMWSTLLLVSASLSAWSMKH